MNRDAKAGFIKPGKCSKQPSNKACGAPGPVDVQISAPSDVPRIINRVEQERDQFCEMVRMKVGEKEMFYLVTIDLGSKEVGKGPRAEIYDEPDICLDVETRRRPFRMQVRPGTEDG